MAAADTGTNPYDGTAVQLVPQNVEKLPLYHWHPGARLLSIGSRDGVAFDGAFDIAEGRTFRRQLSLDLIGQSQQALQTDGLVATWSESLRYPQSLRLLMQAAEAAACPLVVATAGHPGPQPALLDELLERAAGWILFASPAVGPLAEAILAQGRHVEVVLGLTASDPLPELPWQQAAAVHLLPARNTAAVGPELESWEDEARNRLPAELAIYDSRQRHTRCRGCDTVLVWRQGGRSRLDEACTPSVCAVCGRSVPIHLGTIAKP